MNERFCFAVIADSHFHPADRAHRKRQSSYASDGTHNERNRSVVAQIAASQAELVIHLGDVPHPVPGLPEHAEALDVAEETYAGLSVPLHVVPGNHDVGDKPAPWRTAPPVDAARHAVFEARWGRPWQSFDHRGVHFVLIDAPVIGSGTTLDAAQRAWLEADLAAAEGRRTFAFIHYPPFLCDPGEAEHYDNLSVAARRWLLDLFARHRVEALFCGHVHNFFWNSSGETDIYILPATSFVRPEYSALRPVSPGPEFGRDEVDKLGFAFVHVIPDGHRIEPVRMDAPAALPHGHRPPPPSPLGVTLRQDWCRPRDVPLGGLDPFRRKAARDDLPLWSLWDLGIIHVRVPLLDLADPQRARRMHALARLRGMRFTVFSLGAAAAAQAALLDAHREIVQAWEIITAGPAPTAEARAAIAAAGVTTLISAVGAQRASGGRYFSHFPLHGFAPEDDTVGETRAAWGCKGFVARLPADASVVEAVGAVAGQAAALGCPAHAHLGLPRRGEGERYTDDRANAQRVCAGLLAARRAPAVRLFIDPLDDMDRGYHPRNGLLTRGGAPRDGLLALRNLSRLLDDTREGGAIDPGRLALEGAATAGSAWLDLVSGQTHTAEVPARAPCLLL